MKKLISITFLVVTNLLCAQVNLNSSLTACYPMNGNAIEAVNGLNGILGAVTPTLDRFNNSNSALLFSGNAVSSIQLPNSALIKPNQISFSAWVRFNNLNSAQYIVFTHNGCSNYHEGYMLAVNNQVPGGFRLQSAKSTVNCNSLGQITLNGTTLLSPLTWYHVGMYAGPDSIKIYLNGVLESSVSNANSLVYNPLSNVYLGGSALAFNAPLVGSLDNVRFYNRKLHNSEFLQLYLQDPACLAVPGGSVPAVAFSVSSVSLCAGNSISLTDLSANNPTNWNWQIPGANPPNSNQQNPVISFPNPGTYTVSLVASNTVGASNTGTQSIVVLPNPSLSIAGPSLSCSGQTVNLIAGGASSYTWNTAQTGAILNVNPGMSTLYSVTGTDLNGCTNSASHNLNILPSPVIFISASQSLVCQGQSVNLSASGALTYLWNNFQTGNSITVLPTVNSIYQVTGTDASNCSATASLQINVTSLPQVLATANKTLVCRGNPVVLSASGAQTYIWNSSLNGSTVQVQPNFSSGYTVVGTASTGCSQQAIIYITVSECIGLEEQAEAKGIAVSPNPTKGDFAVHFPQSENGHLEIYNTNSQLVFSKKLIQVSEVEVEFSSFAAGIYILLLRTETSHHKLKVIKY